MRVQALTNRIARPLAASGSQAMLSTASVRRPLPGLALDTPRRRPLPLNPLLRRHYSTESSTDKPSAKTLLIVYHSRTDGTRQMAQAAFEAAQKAADEASDDAPITIRMLKAADAGPEDLLSAHAYIFAAPENLAAIAGIMKDFFDRTFYPVLNKLNGRPYACLVCAGSDGENCMKQMDRIATGWRLKRVADGIIVCVHAQTGERCLATKTVEAKDLERCAEVGGALAEGMALGVF